MAVTSSHEERERLRELYRPDEIRVLFVNESPPHGGTFFYRRDSKLYEAMRDTFQSCVRGTRTGSFLERFRDLGCYLEDLCLDSMHPWGADDPRRIAARAAGEGPLAKRIAKMPLEHVFIVTRAIEPNVVRALEAAGHDKIPVVTCGFPYGGSSAAEYRACLEAPLRKLFGSP